MQLLALLGLAACQQPPVVTSISVSLSNPGAALSASIYGGTTVYIYGTGFSNQYNLNSVFFGTVFCDPKNYASSYNQITCDVEGPGVALGPQNIFVGVTGTGVFQCAGAGYCQLRFSTSTTPILYRIIPESASPGSLLSFYGIHRISNLGEIRDLGDVRALYVGDTICNRIDFNDDNIEPTILQAIDCNLGQGMQAGLYNATEWLSIGKSGALFGSYRSDHALERTYNFRVLPSISSVSSKIGSATGQYLTIKGSGFSNNPSNIAIKVAGDDCVVQSASTSQVNCVAVPSSATKGVLAPGALTNQTGGFLAGEGVTRVRYDAKDVASIADFKSKIAAGTLTVLDVAKVDQLGGDIPNQNSSAWGASYKGYLKIERAGTYKFAQLCDDACEFNLATTPNSADSTLLQRVVFQNSYVGNWLEPQMYDDHYGTTTLTKSIPLEVGYYYFETYFLNTGGNDFLNFQMQVPNTKATLLNQVYEIQKVKITSPFIPEIVTFTVFGSINTASYKLTALERNPSTFAVTYNVSVTVAANASASAFSSALNEFKYFNGYNYDVTSSPVDSQGNPLASGTPAGIKYEITIKNYRASALFPRFSGTGLTFAGFTVTQTHSPPLQGTFTLSSGANTLGLYNSTSNQYSILDIPITVSGGQLQQMLNNAFRTTNVQVFLLGNGVDYLTFYVSYVSVPGPVPLLSASLSITGGSGPATATITSIQQASLNLLYTPNVPSNFLYSFSSMPQILVKVNGIDARCESDCSYDVTQNTVTVAGFTLTGATLQLTTTNNLTAAELTPLTAGFPGNTLVEFGGSTCTGITGTLSSFQCLLQTLADGTTPRIEAGSHKPIVHISGIGFANSQALTAREVTLTASLRSGTQVTYYNNSIALISGSNLPLGSYSTKFYVRPAALTFGYCGAAAKSYPVQQLGQNSLQVLLEAAPPISTTCNLVLNYNSKSSTVAITFPTNNPDVTSIQPTTASPVLKTNVVVSGSNFGTDLNAVQVWLLSPHGVQTYQLGVISITDSSLTAVLGGGTTGDYELAVFKGNIRGRGAVFKYQITITAISPNSGSTAGGTVITISGTNFAQNQLSNQVFFGDPGFVGVNALCSILSVDAVSTPNTITCAMGANVAGWGSTQPVVVVGRLIEESLCAASSCSFTFADASTPDVTPPASLNYQWDQTVQVTANLLGVTDPAKITLDFGTNTFPYVATAVTGSSFSFAFPRVPEGDYNVTVRVSPHGNARTVLRLSCTLSITNAALTGLSTNGAVVQLQGSGLSKITTLYFSRGMTWTMYCVVTCVNVTYAGQTSSTPVYTASYSQAAPRVISLAKTTVPAGHSLTQVNISLVNPANPFIGAANQNVTCPFTDLGSSITLTCTFFPGTWSISALGTKGFATVNNVVIDQPSTLASLSSLSYTVGFGGSTISIDLGVSLPTSRQVPVSVCGTPISQVATSTGTSLKVNIPQYASRASESTLQMQQGKPLATVPFGDSTGSGNAFDGKTMTVYKSTSTGDCFLGADLTGSAQLQADVSQIRVYPDYKLLNPGSLLQGAVLEYSSDNSTWTPILTLDRKIHSGWNSFKFSSVYGRYFRLKHDATSTCRVSELVFSGKVLSVSSQTTFADVTCPVKLNGVVTPITINYAVASTPVVTGFSPAFGSVAGNYPLTITGRNFGSTTVGVSVTIDKIPCVVTATTSTSIVCTVGARPDRLALGDSTGGFALAVNENKAVLSAQPFFYAERWSGLQTWGGEAAPREGDSVYVPANMVLMVDVSTPSLFAVVVEGGIIFSDEVDMTFKAGIMVINKGFFKAGSQARNYQRRLELIFSGDYYDRQLPVFGNKGIACYNCKFDLHGTARSPAFTLLDGTVSPGGQTLRVLDSVSNWRVGQQIVVASSSWDHTEAQVFTISGVSVDGLTITVAERAKFLHYSADQTYGSEVFPMRVEVALLNRNIVMKGDDDSMRAEYGSHLMLTGNAAGGLQGRIQNTEFTRCGQPRIVGRYCMHFHMAGDMSNSYVRGNVVHHSFARVLTIHATHYLTVHGNVGYHVKGHNIFLEDGIQTFNVITNNLMISTYVSEQMLQTDLSPASFWVTNPSNTLTNNRAAGGDFYGFWYEIKPNPDGPSANPDICPQGMELGPSRDNVAHSYVRFGLRVFVLAARADPCADTIDLSAADVYSTNPVSESVFSNYILFKNMEAGFLGEKVGNLKIENFKVADSGEGGIQFYKTNLTNINSTATNILIVGQSKTHPGPMLPNMRGLIAPRTDGMLFSNIRFWNFPQGSTPLQSCNKCWNIKVWVTGGKSTFFQQISYNNVQGDYIFWEKWRREIFYDMDGTLTRPIQTALGASYSSATLMPYYLHNDIPGLCLPDPSSRWNTSLVCGPTARVKSILLTNPVPQYNFALLPLNIHRLNNGAFVSPTNAEIITYKIKKSFDKSYSWAAPFVANHKYNLHWDIGTDWAHMALQPSPYLFPAEPATLLRFNYSAARELYDIAIMDRGVLGQLIGEGSTPLDPATCQMGEYTLDRANRMLEVCVSGRNKAQTMYLDLNAVICRYLCPSKTITGTRESFVRKWSNATQWPNGALPSADQNVTIPYEWNLVLDVDPPRLNVLQVSGNLMFDQSRDNRLEAFNIWVRNGILSAGQPGSPFPNKVDIVLHGEISSPYIVLDPEAEGNKMLAVTGTLALYGAAPRVVKTRLAAIAPVGATSILLTDRPDWKVGDEIVIGPTYSGWSEDEKRVITAIAGNNVSFATPLVFEHFGGANPTVSNDFGVLDMRGAVGHLTRNVKISGSPGNWGCRVLVYSMMDGETPTRGSAQLVGVEIEGCGQQNTEDAGLKMQSVVGALMTNVSASAIHNCRGYCVKFQKSENVNFTNNVVHNGQKYLVLALGVDNMHVTDNLLIRAQKRANLNYGPGLFDDSSCFSQWESMDYATTLNRVYGNLCQGSEGEGFAFPHVNCDLLDNQAYFDNTAGSTTVAFMFNQNHKIGRVCQGGSNIKAYASLIGLMANPAGFPQINYRNMMFAENQRSMTLRFAHIGRDNYARVSRIWFSALVRPDCPSCYSSLTNSYCSGAHAIRMLAVTVSGEEFPLVRITNTGFDVICTSMVPDCRAYIVDSQFENFRNEYPGNSFCGNNYLFIRHNIASDIIAGHYLRNTTCINCDPNRFLRADPPNPAWRGWFGGCGSFDCTGPNNYLIEDQTGEFLGFQGSIVPNNSLVGPMVDRCTQVPQMNAHLCHRTDLAVLQFESIAPDMDKRVVWPVNYTHGSWVNVLNGWREWGWDGAQPLNTRNGKFIGLIELNRTYNITYFSQPPASAQYRIQRKTLQGTAGFITAMVYFPVANSIRVSAKGKVVPTFRIEENVNLQSKGNVCGANTYFYTNQTIHFVVNGDYDCEVTVETINAVQVSARLSVTVQQFLNGDGVSNFIDRVCAYLKIPTNRLKIVSINEGSVVVVFYVEESPATSPRSSADSYRELNSLATSLQTGMSSIEGIAKVLSVNTTVIVVTSEGKKYTVEVDDDGKVKVTAVNKVNLGLVLGLAIPGGVILLAIAGYFALKHLRKTKVEIEEISVEEFNIDNHSHIDGLSLESQNKKAETVS